MQLYSTFRLDSPDGTVLLKVYVKKIKTEDSVCVERCLSCGKKTYLVVARDPDVPDNVFHELVEKYVKTLKFLPSRKNTYGIQEADGNQRRIAIQRTPI